MGNGKHGSRGALASLVLIVISVAIVVAVVLVLMNLIFGILTTTGLILIIPKVIAPNVTVVVIQNIGPGPIVIKQIAGLDLEGSVVVNCEFNNNIVINGEEVVIGKDGKGGGKGGGNPLDLSPGIVLKPGDSLTVINKPHFSCKFIKFIEVKSNRGTFITNLT